MSYSISIRAATAALALAAVADAFDKQVLAQQPPHKIDREAALKNADAAIGLLGDPGEANEIVVSMSGSIGGDLNWQTGEAQRLTAATINCSAYFAARTVGEPPKA